MLLYCISYDISGHLVISHYVSNAIQMTVTVVRVILGIVDFGIQPLHLCLAFTFTFIPAGVNPAHVILHNSEYSDARSLVIRDFQLFFDPSVSPICWFRESRIEILQN